MSSQTKVYGCKLGSRLGQASAELKVDLSFDALNPGLPQLMNTRNGRFDVSTRMLVGFPAGHILVKRVAPNDTDRAGAVVAIQRLSKKKMLKGGIGSVDR